jgi:hypothetical protein
VSRWMGVALAPAFRAVTARSLGRAPGRPEIGGPIGRQHAVTPGSHDGSYAGDNQQTSQAARHLSRLPPLRCQLVVIRPIELAPPVNTYSLLLANPVWRRRDPCGFAEAGVEGDLARCRRLCQSRGGQAHRRQRQSECQCG